MKQRLVVNPIMCVGHGLCAELFPEWIHLDDWGYPIIDPRPVPKHYAGHAKRAIAACPTLALMLREEAPAPAPATAAPNPRRSRSRSGS
jgi:ferredoxin